MTPADTQAIANLAKQQGVTVSKLVRSELLGKQK
jgi:hypothetical protein